MKKLFLLTVLILAISFSCQEQESTLEPEVNFQEASNFLSNMFSQTIRYSISNAKFNVNKNQLEFVNSDVIENYLHENYFPELEPLSPSFKSNARTSEDEHHFSEAQESFISDLDYTMNNLTSAEDFYSSIDKFREGVIIHTDMSDEQKLEMLALVEYTNSLHEVLISGGISLINDAIISSKDTSTNGKQFGGGEENDKNKLGYSGEEEEGGCSVEMRAVWASAVIGFYGGFFAGGYAGCAGGTVVLPLVGTATGCVGGAIFGATLGFATGAISGVASELLTSCGSKEEK